MYKFNDVIYSCRKYCNLKSHGCYTQVSNDVLKLVNGNEFKIYFYLCNRYNEKYQYAFPSLNTIATDTDISLKTVKRCIKSLEEKHLIQIEKFESNSGKFPNNIYVIWFPVIVRDMKEEKAIEEDARLLRENIECIQNKYNDIDPESDEVTEINISKEDEEK